MRTGCFAFFIFEIKNAVSKITHFQRVLHELVVIILPQFQRVFCSIFSVSFAVHFAFKYLLLNHMQLAFFRSQQSVAVSIANWAVAAAYL